MSKASKQCPKRNQPIDLCSSTHILFTLISISATKKEIQIFPKAKNLFVQRTENIDVVDLLTLRFICPLDYYKCISVSIGGGGS